MSRVNGIVRVYQQRNIVFLLLFIGIIKFFKGVHILHPACLGADLFPLVPAVGKYHLQRTAHIIKRRIMPAFRLSRLLRLHTAYDIIIPGILQAQSSAQQRGNNHLIIIVGRKSDSCPGQCRRLQKQIVGGLIPHPNGKGWLGKKYMGGGRNAHKGQVVGHIHPVLVLTSHDQILKQAVACKALGAGGVPALVQIVQLHPDAVQKLLGKLPGKPPLLQILFIIGVHILIKTAGRNGMTAGFQL